MKLFRKEMFTNWWGYLLGTGLVALATWLKFLAQPDIIPARAPILYVAIIVPIAIFFGLGPSLLVCILSTLAYLYFFVPPLYSLSPPDIQDVPMIVILLLVGITFSFLSSNLRQKNEESIREVAARKQSEAELANYRDHLEDLIKLRTSELDKANSFLKQEISLREKTEEEINKLLEASNIHQVELEAQAEELRRAQLELQESRDKYLDLYDYAPVGYLTLDKGGNILDANLTASIQLGLERSSLVHSQFTKFVMPESQNVLYFHLRKAFETGARQMSEIQLLRKEGPPIYVQLESIVIYSNAHQETIRTTLTDITQRKKIEETLHENQTLLQAVLEGTPDPVYVKDKQSRILLSNPALEKVAGKPAAEIIGKTDGEYYGDEQVGQVLREHDLQVMQSGLANAVEETVPTPNGPHTFISSKAPYRNASGEIMGIIGISHDITERKKAEEARDRYAIELKAANQELEAFSYSVSHDLKAPLRTLIGFSEAMLTDWGDKLDETGKDYLVRISKASQTMSQLIDAMLILSRVSQANINVDKVSLSDLAASIAAELKATQPDRQVEFIITPDIIVRGDRQLLKILMNNLLQNAWKFTAKCLTTRIELGATEKNGEKVYFVRDNGIGFNMQYADKLFQPFQRLHSKEEYPGTGIGLATVQRVVRRHGGQIWAESEIGKGATFYFTLGD